MARYEVSFSSKFEGVELEARVIDYLTTQKFKLKEYNSEANVYKLGTGFWTAPKFIKFTVSGNEVKLEGWIKNFAIFGESGVDGFVGMLPKRQLKAYVDNVKAVVDYE